MNCPVRYSLNARSSSSCVFITIGPAQAMGSFNGRPDTRMRRPPSVYNNFPWPEDFSEKNQAAVEAAAQGVLDARAKYPTSTLADLYDPLTMPAPLSKAHAALDKAVDRCYRDGNGDSVFK
jgi:hypothetical protein